MGRTKLENQRESEQLWRDHSQIDWKPRDNSKIAQFFDGKNVLVTGATGFLGKLTVEKLLRACIGINTIYILVRTKKGEDEHARCDKLYGDEIYSVLAKVNPKFQHKIVVLKGDISLPNLGLSEADIKTIQERVNVIFHIAATVKFDEKINVATNINVRATRDLFGIAKGCKNLECFEHISTAFSNCHKTEIDEAFYAPPMRADDLIEMVEKTPEAILLQKTESIIKGWPNTYTFTKMLAEDIVKTHSQGIPTCVFRPAIVVPTYREPLRSWIDNLYGMTGVMVGAGTGLLKTMHVNMDYPAEIVPADYVVNSMIALAYKTATDTKIRDLPQVYNYVSSPENELRYEDYGRFNNLYGSNFPSIRSVWCYSTVWCKYKFQHLILRVFLHFLPAIFMDLAMIVSGQKPMMVKIYKKVTKFESVISHFATNRWTFINTNVQNAWTDLGEDDQSMFPFSMKLMDWEEYLKTHAMGLRVYLVKDDFSTLEAARKKWRMFTIAHNIIKTLFWLVLARILYLVVSTVWGTL